MATNQDEKSVKETPRERAYAYPGSCPNCGMRPFGSVGFGPPCRCTPEEQARAGQ